MLSALPPAPPPIRASAAAHVRTHSRTIDNAYGTPAQYDASFGFENWAFAAAYLDLVTPPAGHVAQLVRRGGIATIAYLDVNSCSGSFARGANPYAHPDCAKLGGEAFYHEDGHPERPLTSSDGAVVQRSGNPQSPALQRAAVAEAAAEIAADGGADAVMLDDAGSLGDASYPLRCWGDGTVVAGAYSCQGSPGGAASAPHAAGYSYANWLAGETALAALMPRPVIVNGFHGLDPLSGRNAALDVVLATPGSWGGWCEGCFYNKSSWMTTGPMLDSDLRIAMTATAAGKNVGIVDNDVADPVERERALADVMLFYDADRTWTDGGACGGRSMIHACPEQGLTFYEPVLPYPAGPADVARPGGTYAREFRACYDRGRAIGPCAAVVDPDRTASRPLPALGIRYAHTLAIHGDSLCACYGTSGSVSTDGPAPPRRLPPASGFVLVR